MKKVHCNLFNLIRIVTVYTFNINYMSRFGPDHFRLLIDSASNATRQEVTRLIATWKQQSFKDFKISIQAWIANIDVKDWCTKRLKVFGTFLGFLGIVLPIVINMTIHLVIRVIWWGLQPLESSIFDLDATNMYDVFTQSYHFIQLLFDVKGYFQLI